MLKGELRMCTASNTIRLVIHAVWRGDGNITSVPSVSRAPELVNRAHRGGVWLRLCHLFGFKLPRSPQLASASLDAAKPV